MLHFIINPYRALIRKVASKKIATDMGSKTFVGKGVTDKIMGCVVAPTKPAISAAAKRVWC